VRLRREKADAVRSRAAALRSLAGNRLPERPEGTRKHAQVADRLNRVTFTNADMRQVLAAMRRAVPMAEPAAVTDAAAARAELQRQLTAGDINLSAFTREWRRLDRPQSVPGPSAPVDELRLRRAERLLKRFGDLWIDLPYPGSYGRRPLTSCSSGSTSTVPTSSHFTRSGTRTPGFSGTRQCATDR
jgi:hypothetical protein